MDSILVVLFNYLLGLVENMHTHRSTHVRLLNGYCGTKYQNFVETSSRPVMSVICLLNRVSMCKQSEKCNTALFN